MLSPFNGYIQPASLKLVSDFEFAINTNRLEYENYHYER